MTQNRIVPLTLDNFDISLFDREELMAGAVLEVSWGYPGSMAPPRRVVVKYVTDAKHEISSSGYTCDLKLPRDAKRKGAQDGAKSQTGDKNDAALKKAGEKKQVEMIDPVTGASSIEYHDDGAGSGDPEAKPKKGGG